jgi:hypothetical protein
MNKKPFLQIVSHYKKDIEEKGMAIRFNRPRPLNWYGATFFQVEKVELKPTFSNGLYSLRGTVYSEGKNVGYVDIYPDEVEAADPAPTEKMVLAGRMWTVEEL